MSGILSFTITCLISLAVVSCGDDDPTAPISHFVCDRFDDNRLETGIWADPGDPARNGVWTSFDDIVVGQSEGPPAGPDAVLPFADSLQPTGDYAFIVDMVVRAFRQDLNGGRLYLMRDADEYYEVVVDPESGEYRVELIQMGATTTIVSPATSRCVESYPEDTNRVRLTRVSDQFTLYVNGHDIASFEETAFDEPLKLAIAASGSATFSSACFYTGTAPDLEPVSCELTKDVCDAFSGGDVREWIWSSDEGRSGTWIVDGNDLIGTWPVGSDNKNNAVLPLADSLQPEGDFAFIVDQRVELFDLDRNGGSIMLWNSFQNFYRIIVDPEQQEFWIDAIIDGTRTEVVTQTFSPDIVTEVGELNEIRLERTDGQYSLYINADNVADFEDTEFGGDVKVALGALGQARFDRVCIFTEFIPEL